MHLHHVFTSPFSTTDLQQCVAQCQADDAILLLQDAVYGIHHPVIKETGKLGVQVYVLNRDITARGLVNETQFKTVDDEQWLELCLHYDKVISWS